MVVRRNKQQLLARPVQTASAHTGLLFICPPKRSDFFSASRTGLLWRSVTSSRIWYGMKIATLRCNPVQCKRGLISCCYKYTEFVIRVAFCVYIKRFLSFVLENFFSAIFFQNWVIYSVIFRKNKEKYPTQNPTRSPTRSPTRTRIQLDVT